MIRPDRVTFYPNLAVKFPVFVPLAASRRGVRGEVGVAFYPTLNPSPLVGREIINLRNKA
jgi:hypothetical protein